MNNQFVSMQDQAKWCMKMALGDDYDEERANKYVKCLYNLNAATEEDLKSK